MYIGKKEDKGTERDQTQETQQKDQHQAHEEGGGRGDVLCPGAVLHPRGWEPEQQDAAAIIGAWTLRTSKIEGVFSILLPITHDYQSSQSL